MDELEKLIDDLDQEGIKVDEYTLTHRNSKLGGLSGQREGDCPIILINARLSRSEQYCILAEEAAHVRLTCGNIVRLHTVAERKDERRARGAAYEQLISIDNIIKAWRDGYGSISGMAGYFNVTYAFMEAALEHYHAKYGVMRTVGEWTIQFDPRFTIYKTING